MRIRAPDFSRGQTTESYLTHVRPPSELGGSGLQSKRNATVKAHASQYCFRIRAVGMLS